MSLYLFVVALSAATGAVLLLVGYMQAIPASITKGWRWLAIVLLLPIAGPIWFARSHWVDCSKPGRQLIAGALLMGLALALMYGVGPIMAERAVAMATQKAG